MEPGQQQARGAGRGTPAGRGAAAAGAQPQTPPRGAPLDPEAPANRVLYQRLVELEGVERGRQELMPGLMEALRERPSPREHQTRIKPPKYDSKTDIRQYLELFNNVAAVNQWTDAESSLQLKLALDGTARQCLQGDTFDELAYSLLTRFEPSVDEALRELWTLKWRAGEDLHAFADYAKRLVQRANPGLGDEQHQAMAIREIVEATGDRLLTRAKTASGRWFHRRAIMDTRLPE